MGGLCRSILALRVATEYTRCCTAYRRTGFARCGTAHHAGVQIWDPLPMLYPRYFCSTTRAIRDIRKGDRVFLDIEDRVWFVCCCCPSALYLCYPEDYSEEPIRSTSDNILSHNHARCRRAGGALRSRSRALRPDVSNQISTWLE